MQHYRSLCGELGHYNEALLQRPRLVVASKTDLAPPQEAVDALRAAAEQDGAEFCTLSSISGDGLEDFIDWVDRQIAARDADAAAQSDE